MVDGRGECLYEQWKAISAPVFHTSVFWPSFSQDSIAAFIKGDALQPIVTRSADLKAIVAAREAVESFVDKVQFLDERQYVCKQAYLEFERSRLASLSLIESAVTGQDTTVYNDQLFGSMDSLYYLETLGYLKAYTISLSPQSTQVAEAREVVLAALEAIQSKDMLRATFASIDNCRLRLRPYVESRYEFVPVLVDNVDGQISSDTASTLLMSALSTLFGRERAGWGALVVDGAPNVHIDYDKQAVIVPAGRMYTKDHLKALIIHEIGVHVTRAVHGQLSKERLSAVGLSGYGPTEEALGVLMQHATKPSFNMSNALISMGIYYYATLEPGHTFRGVFEYTRSLLLCLSNPTAEAYAGVDYNRMAFSRTIRMLRLGNGVAVERSTTKYWRGLLLLNDFFKMKPVNEANLEAFFVGKYDPFNSYQYQLITEHSHM